MQLASTRWTSTVLVLILTSLLLYLFVITSEQRTTGSQEQREATQHSEAQEQGETVQGINLDSPWVVTGVLAIWSLIALGLVWQTRWALAGGIGWSILSVMGDGWELANKAAEGDWALAVAALLVGSMHLGIVYSCFQVSRAKTNISSEAAS